MFCVVGSDIVTELNTCKPVPPTAVPSCVLASIPPFVFTCCTLTVISFVMFCPPKLAPEIINLSPTA